MSEQEEMTTHVPESWTAPPPVASPPRRRHWLYASIGAGVFVVVIVASGAVLLGIFTHYRTIQRDNAAMDAIAAGRAPKREFYWEYSTEDVTIRAHDSAEMAVFEASQFENRLQRAGNFGKELVAVVPVPSRFDSARQIEYRLIFKAKSQHENYITKYDEAAYTKAQAAEEKARNERVQEELERIRRRF